MVAWALAVKLLLGECHKTSMMINQHWFRQQATTLANVDQILCHHMGSPGHNELIWTMYASVL